MGVDHNELKMISQVFKLHHVIVGIVILITVYQKTMQLFFGCFPSNTTLTSAQVLITNIGFNNSPPELWNNSGVFSCKTHTCAEVDFLTINNPKLFM